MIHHATCEHKSIRNLLAKSRYNTLPDTKSTIVILVNPQVIWYVMLMRLSFIHVLQRYVSSYTEIVQDKAAHRYFASLQWGVAQSSTFVV